MAVGKIAAIACIIILALIAAAAAVVISLIVVYLPNNSVAPSGIYLIRPHFPRSLTFTF